MSLFDKELVEFTFLAFSDMSITKNKMNSIGMLPE